MISSRPLTLRMFLLYLLGASCRLAWAAPVVAEIKPLTKEEQAKIDAAIDKGVAFLKKAQTRQGDFAGKMYEGNIYLVGQCALPAYALLESGVLADDPVIQRAAAYLRALVPLTDKTYELSLAILFFDRLGDPKDKKLIQGAALRLIAGQHRTGGWSYRCPILDEKNAGELVKTLAELDKRRKSREKTRNQSLKGMEVPAALQLLTVFQNADSLSWQEPATGFGSEAFTMPRVVLDGRTDNSNTQFSLLGLWAARRHDIAVEPALELVVERFERFHVYPAGFWLYDRDRTLNVTSRMSMTCVGLIGLAIGRGLKLPTPGSPADGKKDVHVLRGLLALSRQIGKPRGDVSKRMAMQDAYFLWALERAAVLFNLPDVAGKDWYRWGAQGLITNQLRPGCWSDDLTGEEMSNGFRYKATLCTSFALLFLKRSHPMKDLTAKLPFTAKELNEGIARLRPNDKYPVRNMITPASQGDKDR